MHIGIVSHSYPTEDYPSRGKFIQDEAHLLSSTEDITVFIPTIFAPFISSKKHNIVSEPFPFIEFPYLSFPKKRFPKIIQKSITRHFIRSIPQNLPDLIHVHGLYPSGLILPELNQRKFKTVLTIHGGDWYYTRNGERLKHLLNNSLDAANQIIVAGVKLQKDILQFRPSLQPKMNLIPFGVDTNFFQPVNDKSQLRDKMGWKHGAVHLLCVANMWPVKGLDVLVNAIDQGLQDMCYQFHFVSPPRDPKYSNEIHKMVRDKHLQNIHFYPEQKREDLLHFYQAADIFISPSRRESFGIALIEAAATGLPIVATKSGGPEQIVTPEIGLLTENENPVNLAKKIKNLTDNLDNYPSSKIRENITLRFSEITKKARLLELYMKVLVEE
ncbi:MAG TPA: glycosyltransferase family 4 protein [Balneolales bacterium]|nr:glycosyltransferase family 4 protein [Balneolales bacterium]